VGVTSHPPDDLSRVSLSTRSYFAITVTAINRSVPAGLERDFRTYTALGTSSRKHLARDSVTAILVAICFPCLATFRAAFRLIGIAFGLEELLLLSSESKHGTAIGALKRPVLEIHWMPSSRNIS
jgi:hypothetical protein